jgi:membrane protein required for colicin V production
MTEADYAVLAIIVLSGLFAFFRGFVRELLSVAAWAGAAAATYFGLPYAAPYARQYISIPMLADGAAGAAIFIAALIVGAVVSHMIARRLRSSGFGAVDRSLGLLYGVARGGIVVCVLFLLFDWFFPKDDRPEWMANARSLVLVEQGGDFLRSLFPGTTKRAAAAAENAKRQVEQAIETGDVVGAFGDAPAPDAPGESSGPPGESGYKDTERKDLDRLIQGTQ